MSLVARLREVTGKQSLWDIIKKSGLSVVLDGNWGHSAMNLQGSSGIRLVGEDVMGNKYYEDKTRMYGRHRWVVYENLNDYSGSKIPPEWHAWVHYVDDRDPVSHPPAKRKFDVSFVPHATGTADQYLPKGSWQNPEQRNWAKHEFWKPPSA